MIDFPESEQLTDQLFKKIARYVYDHARINLTEGKRELVRSRLGKVIRVQGFKGYRDFYNYMKADETGEAVREVLNAVSTNLTSFFRESKHFDFLKTTYLPKLVQERLRSGETSLRAWSAGCSTGEEAYTIAITVAERLPSTDWDVKILASDIDTNVLQTGQTAVYAKDRVKSVPMALLHKYFQRTDGRDPKYRVVDRLRRMVVFRQLNLMGRWPFRRPFDFIFCRNVMIYFDRPTQQELVQRYYEHLVPGGFLFIGHSEGLTGITHGYKYVQPTIYQKPG